MKSKGSLEYPNGPDNDPVIKIKKNNAYGENINLKSEYYDFIEQPPSDENWGYKEWDDVGFENPVFGDLPGGDIRCNQRNGFPWGVVIGEDGNSWDKDDIAGAIAQAKEECAREEDCIGFTTIHKGCLDPDNQEACRAGKWPTGDESDRRVHCLKGKRDDYTMSSVGNNPWGEMFYEKKGTGINITYPNNPVRRCPDGTREVNTGMLENVVVMLITQIKV